MTKNPKKEPKEKSKLDLKATTIIFILSVLAGIFIIVFPLVVGSLNTRRANELIRLHEEELARQSEAELNARFAEIEEYNANLAAGIRDEEKYYQLLDFEDGVMGYIEIPRIGIRDPLYHGVEEDVLQKGIGHLPETSLPVGGASTHAALSGHRGLPSSKLFTDLDRVREGDIILIKIMSRVFAYKVYEIEIVEPQATGELDIIPGDDLLTLITCTPYAVNSHRLLVRSRRTEYSPDMENIKTERTISESDRILLIALAIVFLILAIDIFVILARRRKEKEEDEEDEE